MAAAEKTYLPVVAEQSHLYRTGAITASAKDAAIAAAWQTYQNAATQKRNTFRVDQATAAATYRNTIAGAEKTYVNTVTSANETLTNVLTNAQKTLAEGRWDAWLKGSKNLVNLDTETAIADSQNLATAIGNLAEQDRATGFNANNDTTWSVANPFWRALADKAQLSADYIKTTKSAERTYYGRNPWSENQNGAIIDYLQGSRGVLDARRDFEVGAVTAQASLQKNAQAAAGQRDRELADAANALAQARSTYEVSWAQMGNEDHRWKLMESQFPILGSQDGSLATVTGAGTQFIPGLFQQTPKTTTASGTSTGFGGDDLDGYFSEGFLADGVGADSQHRAAPYDEETIGQQAPNRNQLKQPRGLPADDGEVAYETPVAIDQSDSIVSSWLSGGVMLADWVLSLHDRMMLLGTATQIPPAPSDPGKSLQSYIQLQHENMPVEPLNLDAVALVSQDFAFDTNAPWIDTRP